MVRENGEKKQEPDKANAKPVEQNPAVAVPENVKKSSKKGIGIVVAFALVAVLAGVVGWGMSRPADTEATASTLPDLTNIQLGDTITFGSYNNEDIAWRVLRISDDGTEAVVVARDVLTVKAYDAPDSGRYNHDGEQNYNFAPEALEGDLELQAYVHGNSSWENSNIRTWLNATTENVIYDGQAPTSGAMADGVNGYNTEKGFLCDFTEEELAVIKTTEVCTKGNALVEADTVVTQDKVFLLSMDELAWFTEADVSLMAVPTACAVANDKSSWYQAYCLDYGVEATMWWLREPVAESASMCYLVGNGYHSENIYSWEVGVEGFGIRPAMTIALNAGK